MSEPESRSPAGALLAYYSFVGFEVSANVAEEVRDVRRVYARALFGSLLVAGVVCVLVGLAASIVLDRAELAESSGPLLAVVQAADAGIPDWPFSVTALIAVANGALLTMIMASRLVFGMAERGACALRGARVLLHHRTPWVALVVTTAVAMGLTRVGDLATLANTVVLLLLLVSLSTNTAVLVLRRDRVEADHFPALVILPVLAIASCRLLLWQQEARTWLFAGILLAVGGGAVPAGPGALVAQRAGRHRAEGDGTSRLSR
ncbi:APC family permease [Blastococcus colisei]|uniref:APC family permease n=1 Tax=Blastococcus colisei TaxID=1564162 RepID=UPI001FE40FF6|nr:APC family permease [Blastococcus colisei]